MEIVTLCPLAASTVLWAPHREAWRLTVCETATFTLLPGREAVLAEGAHLDRKDAARTPERTGLAGVRRGTERARSALGRSLGAFDLRSTGWLFWMAAAASPRRPQPGGGARQGVEPCEPGGERLHVERPAAQPLRGARSAGAAPGCPCKHSTSTTEGTKGGHRSCSRNARISAAACLDRSASLVTPPDSRTNTRSAHPAGGPPCDSPRDGASACACGRRSDLCHQLLPRSGLFRRAGRADVAQPAPPFATAPRPVDPVPSQVRTDRRGDRPAYGTA
jgi:hypothetical protein